MENEQKPTSESPQAEPQARRTSVLGADNQKSRSSALTAVLVFVPLVLLLGGGYLLVTGLSHSVPQMVDKVSEEITKKMEEIAEAMEEPPPRPPPSLPKDATAPPPPPTPEPEVADRGEDTRIAALTQAIENNTQSAEAWQRRADAWRIDKKWAQAIDDYDMAIALDPLKAVLYNDRGLVFYEMGDAERARNDYSWAVVLDERMDLAYFNRGLLNWDEGNNAAAEKDFSAFLKLNPEDGEAWRRRGQARFGLNNQDGAFEDFSKAIAFDPKDVYALAYRCGTAINLKKHDDAERDCKAALAIDDNLAEALNNLAWLYYKRGDHRAGLPLAERAVKSDPEQAAYWDTRGHLLEAVGERDRAIESFKAALKLDKTMQESIDGLKRLGESP